MTLPPGLRRQNPGRSQDSVARLRPPQLAGALLLTTADKPRRSKLATKRPFPVSWGADPSSTSSKKEFLTTKWIHRPRPLCSSPRFSLRKRDKSMPRHQEPPVDLNLRSCNLPHRDAAGSQEPISDMNFANALATTSQSPLNSQPPTWL